jgi:hypothetical protein
LLPKQHIKYKTKKLLNTINTEQALKKMLKFTKYRDILKPYEVGIRVYSNVNINYFSPLTYDSITKIALF